MVEIEREKARVGVESILVGLLFGTIVSHIGRTPLLISITISSTSYLLMRAILHRRDKKRADTREQQPFDQGLDQFARGLREGLSPEKAFSLYTSQDWKRLSIIRQIGRKIQNGIPLSKAFSAMATQVESEGTKMILSSMEEALEENSREAGDSLKRSLNRIRENREIRAARAIRIRSLLFRVKVLSFTCSMTLALIAALLPMLQWVNMTKDWSQTRIILEYGSQSTAAIVLSLISGISSYCAADLALAEHPTLYAIASIITFWIVFLLAIHLV